MNGTPGASGTGESARIFSSSFNFGALFRPFLPSKPVQTLHFRATTPIYMARPPPGAPSNHILNVYCPPHLQRVTFAELFYRALHVAARQPLVVVGDFNAPSPHGEYLYEKAQGRKLKEFISTLGFKLLTATDPAHRTRLGNSVTRDTCPDLSLTGNIRHVTWENFEENLGSDHFLLRIGFTTQKMRQIWSPALITDCSTSARAVDPHLLHLWEARHSLTRRWRRSKLNRKLRSRIEALTVEATDYSAQLADTNCVDSCMKAAGKMSSKSTSRLFRSLLNPSTTRGETHRQLRLAEPTRERPLRPLSLSYRRPQGPGVRLLWAPQPQTRHPLQVSRSSGGAGQNEARYSPRAGWHYGYSPG
ncbi:hypothetical protein HPB49_006048 [Dermacentor silvarum]|uniref:Uncharacterized protein n=1 Tax=Dermacentor silvarum TaxID=543639 RepID=A0ACB8DB28_DERSI|nr:hypothetical protein HPB49_006048 [Dermacentor silvarum]